MGEPIVTVNDTDGTASVRQGPPLNVGQWRYDPAIPERSVKVAGRYDGGTWRINYQGGGYAVLPEETIRAVYPSILDEGR